MASPPLFENFGQSAKDLLTAISFNNQVTFKNVSDGAVVKASLFKGQAGGCCADKPLNGSLSAVSSSMIKSGLVELDVNTQCDGSLSVTTNDMYGLTPDLATTITLGSQPFVPETADAPASGGCYYKETFQFRRPNFAATTGLITGFQRKYNTIGNASVSVGYEGFCVGVGAQFPVYKADKTPVEVDGGLEYAYKDLVAGLVSSKNHQLLSLHAHWIADKRACVAAALDYNLVDKDAENVMSVASRYIVSNYSTLHTKFSTNGAVALKFTNNLGNPSAQASFAAEFDVKSKAMDAKNFGFQVTFGDY